MGLEELLVDVDDFFGYTLGVIGTRAPIAPEFFEKALRLCAKHPLPKTHDWFLEQITAISNETSKWHDLLKQKIVATAVAQVPVNARTMPIWEQLLRKTRYTRAALQALGHTRDSFLKYLHIWWQCADPVYRSHELNEMYPRLLATFREEPHLLQHTGAGWCQELRLAVNTIFEFYGEAPPFRKKA